MTKFCPKERGGCGFALHGPTNQTTTYYCDNQKCRVNGVNWDRAGNIKRVTYIGLSVPPYHKPRNAYEPSW